MSDDENCDNSPTSNDCDEEELMTLTRIVKRWWEDDSFEKTQSSNSGRWRGRDPDRKIAFKQMFKLKDKIESRSSITWSRRAPEHNMALREIKNVQEEAQSSTIEGGGALKTKREQCYILCLKKFLDKGAFRIHFSHVHLRKMYKCSVEGCLRIFSSEPLRNRHSYIQYK